MSYHLQFSLLLLLLTGTFICDGCFSCVKFMTVDFRFWTLDVSRTASYEITLVRQYVCLSVSFLKIASLIFSDIGHDDSWIRYLVTDEARFLKKNLAARICAKWTKIGPKTRFFYHFFKFGSLVFLEITYNDSLQQCITFSRGNTHEKNFWGPNLGQKGPKSGPKLSCFLSPFSQVLWLLTSNDKRE